MSSDSSGPAQPQLLAPVDEWLTPGRFAALLALLIIVLFPDVIFGDRTFIFRDFGLFGYPVAFYHRESFWRGEVPLWNPLSCSGLPFLAQWNTLVCYPLSLVYLLFPLSWSLAIFCLLHQFLAGVTMYFLAHRWTTNRFAAAVAGLAYAFNGLTLNCLMWPNNIAALAWMPLVILTAERAWREGRNHIFSAALVGSLQMLSGAPEVILFTWAIVFALGITQWVQDSDLRRRLPVRLAGVLLLVISLAGVQLLPFLDLLRSSQRDIRYGDAGWSMPVSGWANFLVPLFHCRETASGVFFQHNQGWTSSYYFGVGVLLFGCLAVWKQRERRVRLLGVLALLSLVLALGDAGVLMAGIRKVLPQIGFMRYPIKFVTIVIVTIPLLAAFAVQSYFSTEARRNFSRDSKRVSLVLVGILLGVLALAYSHPLENESWRTTLRSGLSRLGFLALILGACHFALRAKQPKYQITGRAALLLLLWLDVVTHAPSQNPTAGRSVYEPDLPTFHQLRPKPTPGESRLALSFDSLVTQVRMTPDPAKGFLAKRLALSENCSILENIPKIDGFFSLYLAEERAVHYRIYTSTNTLQPHVADFLGICQVTSETNFFEWQPRLTYLPLITAGQKPTFVDDLTSLRDLYHLNFDPRRSVFLPVEAQSLVKATNSSQPRISDIKFSAQRITFAVETREPTLLVIAQAYYHPWKAYVDGATVRLWRANHAFQAIEVPAHSREVKLVYEDRAFHFGAVISLAALSGCVVAWVRGRTVKA